MISPKEGNNHKAKCIGSYIQYINNPFLSLDRLDLLFKRNYWIVELWLNV